MSEEIKSSENNSQIGQQIIVNQVAAKQGNGVGTAGFVLALIAFTVLIPIVGWFLFPIWLIGLILSFAGVFKKPRGLAIAGLVISLLQIILKLFVFSAILGIGAVAGKATKELAKTAIETTIDKQLEQPASTMSAKELFAVGEKYYYDDKSYTEAAKWYRMSAEQGYAEAQYELGEMYYAGEGVEKNYSEALKWIRKSADQGNANAQNTMGHMYYLGDGVTENFSEAVKWYRKSAEQGNKYAQYNLGKMYESGDGVTLDYEKAVEWYQKAAKNGHEKANDKLKLEYLYHED